MAAPGIQVSADLRSELRELQALVLRTVDDLSTPDDVRTRSAVDKLLSRPWALPTDPPEAVLLGKLHSAVVPSTSRGGALEQARAGTPSNHASAANRSAAERAELRGHGRPASCRTTSRRRKRCPAHRGRRGGETAVACSSTVLRADRRAGGLGHFRATRHVQRVHRNITGCAAEAEGWSSSRPEPTTSSAALGGEHGAQLGRRAPPRHRTPWSARAPASRACAGIVDGLLEFARAGARPEAGIAGGGAFRRAGLLEELGPSRTAGCLGSASAKGGLRRWHAATRVS